MVAFEVRWFSNKKNHQIEGEVCSTAIQRKELNYICIKESFKFFVLHSCDSVWDLCRLQEKVIDVSMSMCRCKD
eukprot:m.290529 g.290529  ORF g.290529 m.290529 type:complete len:74 (+) comp212110_c0_seq1:123-344(+)